MFKHHRGYVEVGQLFGWVVFIAIAGAALYYGNSLYVRYQAGWTQGNAEGLAYRDSPAGHYHGANFEHYLEAYLHTHRDGFPNRTMEEKAYCQGWDDGFHAIVDKILR